MRKVKFGNNHIELITLKKDADRVNYSLIWPAGRGGPPLLRGFAFGVGSGRLADTVEVSFLVSRWCWVLSSRFVFLFSCSCASYIDRSHK